jgi:hypothetical protein
MLKYETSLDYPDYALHEAIPLRIRLNNCGTSAIVLPDPSRYPSPQPTYRLFGPDFPEGRTFTRQSAFSNVDAARFPVKQIQIEPGGTWSGNVPLTLMSNPAVVGEYRLESQLEWQGMMLTSVPLHFQIKPLRIRSAHLAYGSVSPVLGREGRAVLLHAEEDRCRILSMRFQETRPNFAETSVRNPATVACAGRFATDPATPMLNVPFATEMLNWVLWREQKTVYAQLNIAEAPYRCELPEEPERLVTPPLQPHGEPVEVLTLSRRGVLTLIRFGEDESETQILWNVQLPAPPQSITACLAPRKRGSARHVTFVAQQDAEVIDVFHTRYTRDGAPEPFRSFRILGAGLIPETNCALFVNAERMAFVSIAVAKDEGGKRCRLLEVVFPPSDKPGLLETSAIFEMATAPQHGAILYADIRGGMPRCEAVFLDQEHHLYKWNPSEGIRRARAEGTPTTPLLLVPGNDFTYILICDHNRFRLEPI